MTAPRSADSFVVVNGPEDGTEFPIIRSPFTGGSDYTCAVHLTLDDSVAAQHCHATVVSDGYLIRGVGTSRVYVDGKRAGSLRSRVIRSGGFVQIGNTLLCLECAQEGLAARSHGVSAISDLRWGSVAVFRGVFDLIRVLYTVVVAISQRLLSRYIIVPAAIAGVYLFWPQGRYFIINVVNTVYYRVIWPILNSLS